ncbi:MAG: hypothetical protein RL517_117 [Pseudomonadota bacterium]
MIYLNLLPITLDADRGIPLVTLKRTKGAH